MKKIHLRMARQLWATRGRMLMIMMIVAAGVAVYAGLNNSTLAVLRTREVLKERDRFADYQVNFWAVTRDEVPDISKVAGVELVEPRMILNGTIDLPNSPNPLQAKAYFVPLAKQWELNRIEIVEGRYFEGEKDLESAIIDKALATYHNYKVGDSIRINIGRATHDWKIVGISLGPEHLVATANPEFLIPQKGSLGVVYLPKEKQDDLMGADIVTNVSIALAAGTDVDKFEDILKPLFRSVEVDRFEPRADNFAYAFLKKDIDSLRLFIPAMVAVFVVICGFITFAIFGQIIRSQRQEIGTMMALGVKRGQIIRAHLVAGLLVGILGGAVGLVMSMGVSWAFNHDYQKGMGLALIIPYYEPATMIKGFILAIVTALGSVTLPTLALVRLQPIEAVRPQTASAPARPGFFARLLGRSGMARFSFRNITRDKRRFAMTVLSISGAIGVGLAYRTSSISVDRTFEEYFETDRWDLIVEYVEPQIVVAGERVGDLKDVVAVEEYAKGNVKMVGPTGLHKVVQAFGLNYPSELKDHRAVQGRKPSGAAAEIFMNQRLADQIGAVVGDKVRVKGVEDAREMTLVGITEFSPEQVYITLEDAQFLLKQENKVAGALVQVKEGTDVMAAAAARERKLVGNVYLKANIVKALKTHAKELLVIISICIALAMMVACLVITSTVIINLLEREPDYAMVRVLGYGHRKVQKGVLSEILITGGLGVLMAIPLSFFISDYLNAQVGKAFFAIKTVQDPMSILVVCGLTLLFLPLAAKPGLKRIREMNLAETVRKKAMG